MTQKNQSPLQQQTESRESQPPLPQKRVKLQLVGLDGNAFYLLGSFQRAARQQGWTKNEIDCVMQVAKAGDYNHLLRTLIAFCEQ